MRNHYAPVICFCCFLIFFCNIGLPSTSFNVFQPYIAAQPWMGDSMASAVVAVRTFVSLICMFLVGKFVELLGARYAASIAACLTAVAFFVYGLAKSVPVMMLGSVLAGAGYGLGGMVIVTLVTRKWFAEGVGKALGLATAGSGAASLLLPPIVARVIENSSLTWGFWFQTGVGLVCATLIFALLRNDPAEMGYQPFVPAKRGGVSGETTAPAQPNAKSSGLAEPLPKSALAILVFGVLCIACVCVDGYNYFGILLTSEGVSTLTAASIVAVLGLSLTVGKLISGVVIDRIGTFAGCLILFGIIIAGLVCACLSGRGGAFPYLAAVLFGSGATLGSVGISLWSMELSTPENLTSMVKNLQVCYAGGGFLFSIVPGVLMDVCGSYVVSYVILLVLAVVSAVTVSSVYLRYKRGVTR